MSREIYSAKGDLRHLYRATDENPIPAFRLKQPPMNRMSWINQHANIRLISDFSPSSRKVSLLIPVLWFHSKKTE